MIHWTLGGTSPSGMPMSGPPSGRLRPRAGRAVIVFVAVGATPALSFRLRAISWDGSKGDPEASSSARTRWPSGTATNASTRRTSSTSSAWPRESDKEFRAWLECQGREDGFMTEMEYAKSAYVPYPEGTPIHILWGGT